MKVVSTLALIAAIALSTPSHAADSPSETDVRVAYCLKLTEASIELMNAAPKAVTPMLESLRAQVKRKQEEKVGQLKDYLKSRPGVLDSPPAKEAVKTVDADARIDNGGRKSILDTCATSCKTTNPPPTPEGRSCIDACAKEDPVVKRLDRCATLDWLPKATATADTKAASAPTPSATPTPATAAPAAATGSGAPPK